MANFPNQQLTNAGWDALSEALAGRRLTFTKMSVGDGLLDGAVIEEQTDLINRLYDLPLVNYRPGGQGKVFITANLRSAEVTNGFFLREIGLWCRIEGNPVEILYSLCNSGDQSDYVPGKLTDPGETVVIHAIEIQVIIGKAENIEVEVILGLTDGRNVGTGAGVFRVREGNILTFKSLVGGRGLLPIKIEEQEEEITFSVRAGVNGDEYGIEGPPVGLVTTGCCVPYFGSEIPAGFLLCDGSAHSVEEFPRLYAIIGRTYTPSSWTEDTFAVPDCKCRALIGTGGLDYDPGFAPWLGWKGGARTVALAEVHLAAHAHNVDINHYHSIWTNAHNHGDPGHAHYGNYWHAHPDSQHRHGINHIHYVNAGYQVSGSSGYVALTGSPPGFVSTAQTVTGPNLTEFALSNIAAAYASGWTDTRGCGLQNAGNLGGGTSWVSDMATNWNIRATDTRGSGVAHENMQPSLAINYLIKT